MISGRVTGVLQQREHLLSRRFTGTHIICHITAAVIITVYGRVDQNKRDLLLFDSMAAVYKGKRVGRSKQDPISVLFYSLLYQGYLSVNICFIINSTEINGSIDLFSCIRDSGNYFFPIIAMVVF